MASGSLGDLYVNIIANNSQYDKAIDSSKTKTDKFETGLTNLSGTVKKLVGAAALIALAKKIADVGAASIAASSDAQETQNKFDVVFSGISEYANAMAESLAVSYGTSIQGAKDMLSGTGDLLTGLGFAQDSAFNLSKQVLTLGADLASFTNFSGGASGATQILTKALLGERESLKGLGISINEADVKAQVLLEAQQGLTFETEKQAKASATLSLIYGQTLNAQNDFERSSTSYANQLKIAVARTEDLQVQLGRFLLPTATAGVGVFGELTGVITEYIRAFNESQDIAANIEAGTATLEQKLTVLERQLELEETNFQNMRKSAYASRQAIINKDLEITAIRNTITEIEGEIEVKNDAAQLEAKTAADKLEADRLIKEQKLQLEILTAQELLAIQKIQDANKTEIELIDQQIEQLKEFTTLDGEGKKAQLKAIELLQAERQAIINEEVEAKRKQLEALQGDEEAYYAELNAQGEEYAQNELQRTIDLNKKKMDLRKEQIQFIQDSASDIAAIVANFQTAEVNGINETLAADIYALEGREEGTESYLAAKAQLEKDAANEIYKIEVAQFNTKKALALSQIVIDTAIGVAKVYGQVGIFGLSAQIPVIAAGALQAGVVLSEPAPAPPAFATGGVATSATTAIIGDGGGDVMFGMGAKGSPMFQEFIDRTVAGLNSGGGNTTNFYSMVQVTDPQQLRQFAQQISPFIDEYNGGRA